jgi:hypothetical protein
LSVRWTVATRFASTGSRRYQPQKTCRWPLSSMLRTFLPPDRKVLRSWELRPKQIAHRCTASRGCLRVQACSGRRRTGASRSLRSMLPSQATAPIPCARRAAVPTMWSIPTDTSFV